MTMTISEAEDDYNYDSDYASPYKINIFLSNLLYIHVQWLVDICHYSSNKFVLVVVD